MATMICHLHQTAELKYFPPPNKWNTRTCSTLPTAVFEFNKTEDNDERQLDPGDNEFLYIFSRRMCFGCFGSDRIVTSEMSPF
jgi:hypothetical protein